MRLKIQNSNFSQIILAKKFSSRKSGIPPSATAESRYGREKTGKILNFSFWFCLLLFSFFLLCSAEELQQNSPAEKTGQETAQQAEAKSREESPVAQSLAASGDVTLDFKEADIQSVLKIISYKSGVNIVTTPDVIGNVTIRLVDVPWEKALDTIVKTHNFGYEWLSTKVIMVSTLEKLAQQRKAQQEAAEMEPIDTETFTLNFSKAEDIKNSIEKLVSARGKITLENRTNTLIITDTKSKLIKIGEIIKILDKITPQVMIEAKIIETTLGSAEKLGIDWTIKIGASGSKRPTTLPWTEEYGGTGKKYLPKTTVPSEVARVTSNTYQSGTLIGTTTSETTYHKLVPGFPEVAASEFVFGTIDFSTFQAILEVLKSRSDTKIISNPRITTLNNQEAKMLVGKIVPIAKYEYSKETGTQVISGYEDKEVGVKLVVTPNINEKDYITLNINPSVDEIIGFTGPNGERPVISTRSAETKVMIKDGQTLVIGGLISENRINSKKGIPILGDLPILDLIFGKKEGIVEKTELLIFVTPHIIKEGETSIKEISALEEKVGIADKKETAVTNKKRRKEENQ